MKKYSLLFVCYGNICRSPLAQGIFQHLAQQNGLQDKFHVDSCGIADWQAGSAPHSESIGIANQHGISIERQVARQISRKDLDEFDLIVVMDRSNERDVHRFCSSGSGRIVCLREYDPEYSDPDVPDPFYGGKESFEETYRIIARCIQKLFDELERRLS